MRGLFRGLLPTALMTTVFLYQELFVKIFDD